MYVDGHERQDVMEYRQAFVERFKEYKHRFHAYDDAGNELPRPSGFNVPRAIGCFRLILVTHNELIFYQNDQREIHWGRPGGGAPKPKGEGVSLMISDFLTADWGCLRDNDRCVATGFSPLGLTHACSVKPESSSSLASRGMDGLNPATCSPRWTMPLTFSTT